MDEDWISLICVRVGGRLRVRITTPGYYNEANCMFPRDLRVEGAQFRTRRSNIKLIARGTKYYYSSGSKTAIERIAPTAPHAIAVYEDAMSVECAICFDKPKSVIIDPCGHFYMCRECASQVHACPICRGPVHGFIDRAAML